MEPDRNPNVSRSQRQVFYNVSRRYGAGLYLYKVATSGTDYSTGAVTRTYDRTYIRNAVHVPNSTTRNVTYTPAMMQAVRQYAWQGGAGQDLDSTTFLISDRDLRGWCLIDPTQFISWRGGWYQVTSVQDFDGGVIVQCKQAKGSGPASWEDIPAWDDCNNWTD